MTDAKTDVHPPQPDDTSYGIVEIGLYSFLLLLLSLILAVFLL